VVLHETADFSRHQENEGKLGLLFLCLYIISPSFIHSIQPTERDFEWKLETSVYLYTRASSTTTTTSAIMDCLYILSVVQKSASISRANKGAGEARAIGSLKPFN